jgi:hypothetical protein
MLTGELSGPFLDQTLKLLQELLSQDLEFREKRAQNAPLAVNYDQQSIAAGVVYIIEQAQSSAEYFTELLVVFDQTSGLGRYMLTSQRAQPTLGFPIASGASFLRVVGQQNIRNFSLTPQAGQTLVFSRILFK